MNRAPAPLHVPDFSLVPQDDRRSDVLPPLPDVQEVIKINHGGLKQRASVADQLSQMREQLKLHLSQSQ